MTAPQDVKEGKHVEYFVDLEGREHPWPHGTITVPQVRELAGWPPDQQVTLVDVLTNEETTLAEDAIVELLPGKAFGRKFKFKRGLLDRIEAELGLLRQGWPNLQYSPQGHWVLIAEYPLTEGWSLPATDIAFQIPSAATGAQPYGFYVRRGLTYAGQDPTNCSVVDNVVPFSGTWSIFSWAPETWHWAEDPARGANMVTFARSFTDRFADGA